MLSKSLCLLQLSILTQRFEGSFASIFVAGGEVDKKRAGIEGRLGVLERELSD